MNESMNEEKEQIWKKLEDQMIIIFDEFFIAVSQYMSYCALDKCIKCTIIEDMKYNGEIENKSTEEILSDIDSLMLKCLYPFACIEVLKNIMHEMSSNTVVKNVCNIENGNLDEEFVIVVKEMITRLEELQRNLQTKVHEEVL